MLMNKKNGAKIPPPLEGNDGAALQWKMRNISHARMHVVTDMLSEYGLHYTYPRIRCPFSVNRIILMRESDASDIFSISPAFCRRFTETDIAAGEVFSSSASSFCVAPSR